MNNAQQRGIDSQLVGSNYVSLDGPYHLWFETPWVNFVRMTEVADRETRNPDREY